MYSTEKGLSGLVRLLDIAGCITLKVSPSTNNLARSGADW